MSTRSLVTVAGGLVGAYFGYPQLGLVLGGLIGAAVDPTTVQGPAINEVTVQTQAEGVPRIIPWGTVECIGNIIQNGPLIKTTETETQGKGGTQVDTPTAYRTFAIGICEGPIAGLLRMWEDNKLVVDMRPGSLMLAESAKYLENKFLRLGGEDQEVDPFLEFIDPETPAYRGTAFMTFVLEDQTDRGGSFKQYRFEVAKVVEEVTVDLPPVEAHGIASVNSGGNMSDYFLPDAPMAAPGSCWLCTWVFKQVDVTTTVQLQAKVGGAVVWSKTISLTAGSYSAAPLIYKVQINAPNGAATITIGVVGSLYGQIQFSTYGLTEDYGAYAREGGTPDLIYEETNPDFGVLIDDSENLAHAADVSVDPNILWGPDSIVVDVLGGGGVTLSSIVSDIHQRCGVPAGFYSVAELADLVDGFSVAGPYTGADAINALRAVYMFDKSDHDGRLWYPKRGKAVVKTLTIDDLTEVPDTSQREQASEIPYKVNLKYQHAASGYAEVKATAPSTPSPDRRTTGEVSMATAVVLDENQAAQTVDKIYKITLAEANGTTELSVPLAVAADLADADCVGLYLRGRSTRLRIEQSAFTDWTVKLTLKADRQSAYTSNVTGIPIPPPTLPPSTIVGDTELAVMDIAARTDSEDDLSVLVAVVGANEAWYGAQLQRSTDAGATYSSVQTIERAAVMGTLVANIPAASEFYTDTTNRVNVALYRSTQTLDTLTDQQFLSEQGAFALEKSDGTWEVMQYRDAVLEFDDSFTLSVLHRGLLNSGASAHTAGARFVLLATGTHVATSASWLGMDLTHRAVSLGESADDTDNETTAAFVGRSQREWPVASLALSEVAGVIDATWAPRHRFGSDDAPVASANFTGYRVTVGNVAQNTVIDTTTAALTAFDASAIPEPFVVSVAAMNRITGPGEAASVVIGGVAPATSYRPSGHITTSNPYFAHQIGSTVVTLEQATSSSSVEFFDENMGGLGGYGVASTTPYGLASIGNITYALFTNLGGGSSRLARFDRTVSLTVPTHIQNYSSAILSLCVCGADVWISDPYGSAAAVKLNPATLAVSNYMPLPSGPGLLASDGTKVYAAGAGVVHVIDNAAITFTTIPLPVASAVGGMVWAAGSLIVMQANVPRALNPATGAVLQTLAAADGVTAAGNVVVLYRGISNTAQVLQAADLEIFAEVDDPATPTTNVFALSETRLLVATLGSPVPHAELFIS
jgi:hypothetical protein